jgi:hypothetical protein
MPIYFTYCPREQIDQTRWDACVGQVLQFLFYGVGGV